MYRLDSLSGQDNQFFNEPDQRLSENNYFHEQQIKPTQQIGAF